MSDGTRKPPPKGVMRAANRIVRPLLNSRLHGLVSRRLMLLEYTGRRTGARYTVPVGYRFLGAAGAAGAADAADAAGQEVIATSMGTSWPVNLRGGAPVRLRLRGQWHKAEPVVVEEPEAVADLLGELAERQGPGAVAALRVGLPGDRQPTREELLAAGARVRVGRFRLTG